MKIIKFDNLSQNFDKEIQALIAEKGGKRVQPIWRNNLRGALDFAHNALDAATQTSEDGDIVGTISTSELSKSASYADKASAAVSLFARHLVRSSSNGGAEALSADDFPTESQLQVPLYQMNLNTAVLTGERWKIRNCASVAKKDAKVLLEAFSLLKRVVIESGRLRDSRLRQNPGSPQQRIFARAMVEAWIYLTGKKPSANNNRFDQFLTAARSDVSNEEVDWTHSVRVASKDLTAADVAKLTEHGPSWK